MKRILAAAIVVLAIVGLGYFQSRRSEPQLDTIRRAIGPGDRIEIREGSIFVNGKSLAEANSR